MKMVCFKNNDNNKLRTNCSYANTIKIVHVKAPY